jgi:uncharacterized membrane protein
MIRSVKTICTVVALGFGVATFSTAFAQTPAAPAAPAEKPAAAKPAAKKTTAKPAATPVAATPAGPAVFPTAIDPKYAKAKPGQAKLKTCADQYKANKATNANGGLKWIVKGGGYWSECSKKLQTT